MDASPENTATADVERYRARLFGLAYRMLGDVHDAEDLVLLERLGPAVLSVFAGDATFTSDGGGKVPAARRVLAGPERIARFLLGLERKYAGLVTHRIARLNDEPAVVSEAGGRVAAATLFQTDGERILAVFRVLNPDKLRHVR